MTIDQGRGAPVSIVGRGGRHQAETSGLVPETPDSPMLQPWEVYDQELFDLEMVRSFGRSWVWLGDTEDLREPGDYLTADIGSQPVIVIKQVDGSVKGFLNNCRHRASGLAFDPAGHCGKTLTCPYHNWAYSIDGSLIGIPDKNRMYGADFPMGDYGLVPIRIHLAWDTLVFGCLSRRAPSFREWIAPVVDRYDRYEISRFRRFHRELDQTYDINWKAFVENSNDDYHVRFVHRRLNDRRENLATIVRFEGRITSGYKPHRLDVDDPSGGRSDLPEEALKGHYAEFFMPNLTPLPHPTLLILVRADPIAPDRTRLVSRIYGLTEDLVEQEEHLQALEATNKEDTDMVTVLMKNLRSPFYRVGPPSAWEGRAAHVMRTIREDVATPLAPDEFAGPVDEPRTAAEPQPQEEAMTEFQLTEPRLTHVALPVSDLDATIEFFTSLCNLVVVSRNEDAQGRGAWLSNDKQVVDPFVLVLAEFVPEMAGRFGQTPGEKVPTLAPFAHIGIELPTRADVDAVADRARAMGCLQWEPTEMAAHIGYICAALDPDGNVVEFSHNQKVYATVRGLWGDAG